MVTPLPAVPLDHYRTWVFDCDGVVLDSNKVKTEAFYQAALPYGERAAEELAAYHVSRGGVSRYRKFEHFLTSVVAGHSGPGLDELLEAYAAIVRERLMTCQVAARIYTLREHLPDSRWLIVSGGDQAELRELFRHRKLDHLFDGGIFGSPDSKDLILRREIDNGNIAAPAVFLGDSRYDYEAAASAGLDFVFVSGWSETDFPFPDAHYRIDALSDLVRGAS